MSATYVSDAEKIPGHDSKLFFIKVMATFLGQIFWLQLLSSSLDKNFVIPSNPCQQSPKFSRRQVEIRFLQMRPDQPDQALHFKVVRSLQVHVWLWIYFAKQDFHSQVNTITLAKKVVSYTNCLVSHISRSNSILSCVWRLQHHRWKLANG